MNWIHLNNPQQLEEIIQTSQQRPQVIFKHSTRCGISSMAKGRLERSQIPKDADFYHLDLIANRSLSAKVAEVFKVPHESPQILVIRNGACVFSDSHYSINMEDISEMVG